MFHNLFILYSNIGEFIRPLFFVSFWTEEVHISLFSNDWIRTQAEQNDLKIRVFLLLDNF